MNEISKLNFILNLHEEWQLFMFGMKDTIFIYSEDLDKKILKEWLEDLKSRLKRLYSIQIDHFWFLVGDKKNPTFSIIISRKKIPKDLMNWFLQDQYKTGIYLGYPKCCVKKYVEDFKDDSGIKNSYSFYASERYLKQLKEMNIKKKDDLFHVFKKGSTGNLGFVPCSPKCKKAKEYYLKFLETQKQYNEMKLK